MSISTTTRRACFQTRSVILSPAKDPRGQHGPHSPEWILLPRLRDQNDGLVGFEGLNTHPSPVAGNGRGFTLVELMIVVVLSGFVLTGVLTTYLQLMRSGTRVTQYAEMSAQVRRGLESVGVDLQNASAITWNSASDITLTVPTLAGATRDVTYAWTAATQSLFLVPGTSSTNTAGRVYLVSGIPAYADGTAGVTFTRFDRDGVAATTDLVTKRVQVILNVVRSAQTAAKATDPAVSAAFLLRNKPVS